MVSTLEINCSFIGDFLNFKTKIIRMAFSFFAADFSLHTRNSLPDKVKLHFQLAAEFAIFVCSLNEQNLSPTRRSF